MVDLRTLLAFTLLALLIAGCGQNAADTPGADSPEPPSANEVLRRSLQFHDPAEAWGQQNLRFIIDEPRVGFPERQSIVVLGMADDYFEILRSYDGVPVLRHLSPDSCYSTVEGERVSAADTAVMARYGLQCERTEGFRRFYRLLNGMPMSLFSPEVSLNEGVTEVTVGEAPCYRITARLNQEIISEAWFFDFDQRDYRLRGYGFANEEAGEYLRIDGLVRIGQMQLPRMRHWYSQTDSTYLGSDILVEASLVEEANSTR
ncbi:MAG TPA: DUF6503 family protein [Phaeodactylibacter sp.]|nr:DUF6503 family protein [Phaeodactylibacter sp.]